LTDEQRKEQEKLLKNFFTNALRLSKLRKKLPTAHIHAMCHAVYRWDKKRKFDGNDLLDFHHATAALAYCDVFLTDGPSRGDCLLQLMSAWTERLTAPLFRTLGKRLST